MDDEFAIEAVQEGIVATFLSTGIVIGVEDVLNVVATDAVSRRRNLLQAVEVNIEADIDKDFASVEEAENFQSEGIAAVGGALLGGQFLEAVKAADDAITIRELANGLNRGASALATAAISSDAAANFADKLKFGVLLPTASPTASPTVVPT
ncbi:hypothetical protein M885DRAFT_510530, partial [Pelagophyceae sp. CCMP2097]